MNGISARLARFERCVWVQGVAKAVAHEGEGHHKQTNGYGREKDHVWRRKDQRIAFLHHGPPARSRRADTDADVTQSRFNKYSPWHGKGYGHNNGAYGVGQDMLYQDPSRRRAQSPG